MNDRTQLHKLEITAPDGKKLVAHGNVHVSIGRELIDVTRSGILGGPADFAKRFAPGATTLRVEMMVAGEVVQEIPPPKRAKKRGKR